MGESPNTGNSMGKEKGNSSLIQVSAIRTCLEWRQKEVRLESTGADQGVVDDRA